MRDIHALEAAARQCEGLKAFRAWMEAADATLVSTALKTKTRADDADPPELKEFKATHRAAKRNWQLPNDFPNPAVIEAYAAPKYVVVSFFFFLFFVVCVVACAADIQQQTNTCLYVYVHPCFLKLQHHDPTSRVDSNKDRFEFGRPDLELLRGFCQHRFGWEFARTDQLLTPVLEAYDRRESQLRIENFLSFRERFAKIRSKRLAKALKGITGGLDPEMEVAALAAADAGGGEVDTGKAATQTRASRKGTHKAPAGKARKRGAGDDAPAAKKRPRVRRAEAAAPVEGEYAADGRFVVDEEDGE